MQSTEEKFNVLLKYSRGVPFPLEEPQEDSDYQDGIKHNTGLVYTLTIPFASRKRGREVEKKNR